MTWTKNYREQRIIENWCNSGTTPTSQWVLSPIPIFNLPTPCSSPYHVVKVNGNKHFVFSYSYAGNRQSTISSRARAFVKTLSDQEVESSQSTHPLSISLDLMQEAGKFRANFACQDLCNNYLDVNEINPESKHHRCIVNSNCPDAWTCCCSKPVLELCSSLATCMSTRGLIEESLV